MKKYFILLLSLILLTGCGAPKDTLSINGMYIGKKAPADRDHLVMDASFTYMDKDVGYDVDSEGRIEYMAFYTLRDAKGEMICDLSDIKFMYHGKQLVTTQDFIDCFGENYIPAEGEKYDSFTFEDDELMVTIELIRGEVSNIEVSPR